MLLLALCALAAAASALLPADVYEASVGAIVKQTALVPYEDHLIVIFNFSLPNLANRTDTQQDCPLDNSYLCVWEAQLHSLRDALQRADAEPPTPQVGFTNPGGLYPATYNGLRRQRRAFWSIAATAIPLVAEYFPKLVSLFKSSPPPPQVEQNAVIRYQQQPVAGDLSNLPSKLLLIQKEFPSYKEKLQRKKGTDLSDKVKGLDVLVQALFEINTIDQAISVCSQHLLPPRLVKLKLLKSALQDAQQRLMKFDSELLVPLTSASAYYQVRSAFCYAVNNTFFVHFKIPIKRQGTASSLYSLYPAPFKIDDVVCYLLKNPLQIALINQKPYFLPPDYCKDTDFFCQIPRDINPTELESCLAPFFSYRNMGVGKCEPSCTRSTAPVVIEIEPRKFWVATDDQFPLTIDCSSANSVLMANVTVGAKIITLPCNCRIVYGTNILVAKRLVCDQHNTSEVLTNQVVPLQWTKRVPPPFMDVVTNDLLILRSEVTTDQEDEVQISGESDDLPHWVQELLAGVGGALLLSVAGFVAAAIKRRCQCCRQDGYLRPRRTPARQRPVISRVDSPRPEGPRAAPSQPAPTPSRRAPSPPLLPPPSPLRRSPSPEWIGENQRSRGRRTRCPPPRIPAILFHDEDVAKVHRRGHTQRQRPQWAPHVFNNMAYDDSE